jgi:hypothetical protein
MKPCCEDLTKREVVPSDQPDVTITRCTVCGCRHFELSVDPGALGVTGMAL